MTEAKDAARAAYAAKLQGMDEKAFVREASSVIYQSARCSNNRRSDWNWMVDACWNEARRREPGEKTPSLYERAYRLAGHEIL